jgi:hypothetical protein
MIFGIDTASVAGNKNPDWVKAKATGSIAFARAAHVRLPGARRAVEKVSPLPARHL